MEDTKCFADLEKEIKKWRISLDESKAKEKNKLMAQTKAIGDRKLFWDILESTLAIYFLSFVSHHFVDGNSPEQWNSSVFIRLFLPVLNFL